MLRGLLLGLVLVVTIVVSSAAATLKFSELLARPRVEPSEFVIFGPAPRQYAELWLPSTPGPHRTIILVHGGCWLAELPGTELMAYIAEDLRQRGFAVYSIDYRRIGDVKGGYPGTFIDTLTAMDELRKAAPKFNLNLTKLVAVGHSAGGHLASWAAARSRLPKTSVLYRDDPLRIAGVVSLAGINDLKLYREKGPAACGGPATIDSLVGARTRGGADVFADTSPAALLPLGMPQVVISGDLDLIVPPMFGKDYAAMAAAKGDVAKELTIREAGHFELIDPTSAAWVKIRAEIEELMK